MLSGSSATAPSLLTPSTSLTPDLFSSPPPAAPAGSNVSLLEDILGGGGGADLLGGGAVAPLGMMPPTMPLAMLQPTMSGELIGWSQHLTQVGCNHGNGSIVINSDSVSQL